MVLLLGAAIFGYLAVALLFFALNFTELLETERATPAGVVAAFLSALFWPVTLLVMSALVALTRARAARQRI